MALLLLSPVAVAACCFAFLLGGPVGRLGNSSVSKELERGCAVVCKALSCSALLLPGRDVNLLCANTPLLLKSSAPAAGVDVSGALAAALLQPGALFLLSGTQELSAGVGSPGMLAGSLS